MKSGFGIAPPDRSWDVLQMHHRGPNENGFTRRAMSGALLQQDIVLLLFFNTCKQV